MLLEEGVDNAGEEVAITLVGNCGQPMALNGVVLSLCCCRLGCYYTTDRRVYVRACVRCTMTVIAPVCGCGRRLVTPTRWPAALRLAPARPACLPSPAVACLVHRRRFCFLLVAQRGGRVHGASLPGGVGAVGVVGTGGGGTGGLVGGALPSSLCPLGPHPVPPPLTRCSRGRGLTPWAEGRLPSHHGRPRGAPLQAPPS